MGITKDNAQALRDVANQSLRLSVDIDDTAKNFMGNCYAIGERCEEFWPQVEESARTASNIAKNCGIVLSEYANLMIKVADEMDSMIGSGLR